MMGRTVLSLPKLRAATAQPAAQAAAEAVKSKSWGRKLASGSLICLTGGVALSAIDDLLIYHGCSSKAMEIASKNQAIIEAIGEPIVRGPWYNASLAIAHKRHSVSCTFPVSGPQGSGMFQLKAVCDGDDTWFSFLRRREWEILIMEALLHVPGNEKKQQTYRIGVSDNPSSTVCNPCTACSIQPSESLETNQPQPG